MTRFLEPNPFEKSGEVNRIGQFWLKLIDVFFPRSKPSGDE
jgi:hypothetical protein